MAHLHPHRADDDQVFQKYLDRAIVDIHSLGDDVAACGLCDHDDPRESRVLGTGHPLADVMLVKWSPSSEELDFGVAFHGRSGDAIRRSVERLAVDPLDLYGTNLIKCSSHPTACMRERCPEWLLREIRIVEPKLLVVMGQASLDAINGLEVPDASRLEPTPGAVQRWTHACEAIWCPDIDDSLDRPASKQAFWQAFRVLGEWYSDKPPF
ncbi:MAG: Uracil-DNA glycosylase-like protein [Thermoleophilia bacterium]|nr:Uracil-DNA glycosylase-like protein [Thermoleophilia bacterium]